VPVFLPDIVMRESVRIKDRFSYLIISFNFFPALCEK